MQQTDLLIQEIESVDDYWGPTFRAIYDGQEHQKFMEKLDERIKSHDREIEKMCSQHYQGFINSIKDLLHVRTEAQSQKKEIEELDQKIGSSIGKLREKREELVKARKTHCNMAAAMESLAMCLPVVAAYGKLQEQMNEKRYYSALKTLEQLESYDLPKIPNYRFTTQIIQNIPLLRENIKEATMTDLRDFLENMRKHSPRIGEIAMRQTAEQLERVATIIGRKKYKAPNKLDNADGESQAQNLMDFSPLYRCNHIFTVLKEGETFQSYYRQQRQQQARLVVQPPINMHESITGYQSYVYGIIGFFVIEEHILQNGGNLAPQDYLDELWSTALTQIVNALRTHSAYCTDATLILRIKNLIMVFNTTLRNYKYPVGELFDLLQEIRVHYNEVLMQHWVQVFRDILDEDDFLPIQVNNEAEYDKVVCSFPFRDDELEKMKFPKKFPFSRMVPKVYHEVKEFIYACLKFSDDLNLTQSEVDEMVCKSTNLLLTRTFSGCLSSHFRKPSLALLQVIQIIINTGYLENSTKYLEEFLSNITGTPHEGQLSTAALKSAMFRVARDDAEKQICEKLKQKIDEFLELENYDWSLIEAQGHASGFIADLISFLQSTFLCFTNLPDEVAQIACQSACSHIAKSILNILISDELKQYSMGALQQINLDTIQCEHFAASEPVPGLPEGILLQQFSQLRQVLDLFMSWDWPTYFHDYGSDSSKYNLVSPVMAVIILEKLREADKKTVFSVLKKSERDKKKLLETVLRQLRQLAQTTQ